MENQEDNQDEDRPSAPELLGTSAEQIKRQGEPAQQYSPDSVEESPHDSKVYQLYIGIASLILLLLGLAALGIWYFADTNNNKSEEMVDVTPSSLIYTESKEEIEVTAFSRIRDQVRQISTDDLQKNSFSQIFFTRTVEGRKSLVAADELLDQLSRDQLLLSAYVADNFMYGTYKADDGEESHYIIFGITSYDNAYGTMLQTESAVIAALTSLGFPRIDGFSDVIIKNQDVRVGGASDGTRVYYSFPRQNRFVITTSEEALREIFDRIRRR